VVSLAVLAFSPGCRIRESPEAVRAKVAKEFLERQLVSLEALLQKAERGELVTADQIAIGVDEAVAREILNAPLPLEQAIGERVRIRIEKAEPFFRGNQAAIGFRALASSPDLPNQFAELELGGGLEDLKLVEGRLAAKVSLFHFSVTKASVGPLAQGLVESLVRDNLGLIQGAIPPFEVPVRLDQQLKVDRFQEGPVAASGGELPLQVQVSQVLQLNQRLWVLIDAKAGPWKPAPAPTASPPAKAPPQGALQVPPRASPGTGPSPAAAKNP
jgi:hypothetical protein